MLRFAMLCLSGLSNQVRQTFMRRKERFLNAQNENLLFIRVVNGTQELMQITGQVASKTEFQTNHHVWTPQSTHRMPNQPHVFSSTSGTQVLRPGDDLTDLGRPLFSTSRAIWRQVSCTPLSAHRPAGHRAGSHYSRPRS